MEDEAPVARLPNAPASKAGGGNALRVRIPPGAPGGFFVGESLHDLDEARVAHSCVLVTILSVEFQ